MIEEPELSMKLKTYNVVLRINTLEDENTEGDPIISEYLQSELEKKIYEEICLLIKKVALCFLFLEMLRILRWFGQYQLSNNF